jgi:hypothetical protein
MKFDWKRAGGRVVPTFLTVYRVVTIYAVDIYKDLNMWRTPKALLHNFLHEVMKSCL